MIILQYRSIQETRFEQFLTYTYPVVLLRHCQLRPPEARQVSYRAR